MGYVLSVTAFLSLPFDHWEVSEVHGPESHSRPPVNGRFSIEMPQKTAVRMFAKTVDNQPFLRNRARQAFLVPAMKAPLIIRTRDHLVAMVIQLTAKIFARYATVSSPIRCQ